MKIDDFMPDEYLTKVWQGLDWTAYKNALLALQRDLAFAALKRNASAIAGIQKRIVRSLEAKALAVRQVCDAASQPGVDGVKWRTDAEKMRATYSLNPNGYVAMPTRLVTIVPKGQHKERRVQIPTYYDRAMQTLFAYTLDPVAEATADMKSFAFRKGRSAYDVHAYILRAFDMENPPRYILKADVRACYASISHQWILDNIPADRRFLREMLNAGHMLKGELFPADDFGISIGSSISPIIANMTLNGIQHAIFEGLHGRVFDVDYVDGDLIRFADDILVTARTMDSANKIRDVLASFLAVRGLELSEEKTRVIDIEQGFDFLSRNYRMIDGIIRSSPSDAAIAKIELKLRDLITPYRGNQRKLIKKINYMLGGWASYHKISDAEPAFRRIDSVVTTLLFNLCRRVHRNMAPEKIKGRYFYKDVNGDHVYCMEDKPDERVLRLIDTVLIKHTPVLLKKNPYIDDDYFENRTHERAISAVTGSFKSVWRRQKGRCFYCGRRILVDEEKRVVLINPQFRGALNNLAYIHEYCSRDRAEIYISDADVESRFDLHSLLVQMLNEADENVKLPRKSKFDPLTEYFRQRSDPVFTLTFGDIENIMNRPLCRSARTLDKYWRIRAGANMGVAWRSNGYAVRKVNLKKAYIVFERVEDKGVAVKIPDVFLTGKIPDDAKAEMDIMFHYIRKKYGI